MKKISSGKVREIYEVDDKSLLMVVSDRISAFDVILPNEVPDKGKILNKISEFWFDFTKSFVTKHCCFGKTNRTEKSASCGCHCSGPSDGAVGALAPISVFGSVAILRNSRTHRVETVVF